MKVLNVDHSDQETLAQLQTDLNSQFNDFKQAGLHLDLTRGKPSPEQLSLSNELDGILQGNYFSDSGTDTRNYGGIDGLAEIKQLAANILKVDPEYMLIGGNSSLTLMYQTVLFAQFFGLNGPERAWVHEGTIKFLCPIPGYDRHFTICERLGIEMIPVEMDDNGPNMDMVEALISNDNSIKGIWCVPRFSNPTGIVYSDETVDRLARLGALTSADNFYVFWDNAYAIHGIEPNAADVASLMDSAHQYKTEDSVILFGSTSKVSFAGAGIAFMASSLKNLSAFKNHLSVSSIGPNKVNQLRHIKLFPNKAKLDAHMQKHAALLKPRFNAVLNALETHFDNNNELTWTTPKGGYFVSVDTQPGLAKEVVHLAGALGVKLTPAGATFPYGQDPLDTNIRLAPSFPSVDDIKKAMEVFVLCVKLAMVNQAVGT